MTSAASLEPIIEPDLPIVDAHHHLWVMPEAALKGMEGANAIAAKTLAPTYRRHARYLLDEFLADLNSGHNIRATVFADCYAMYRSSGPDQLKSVGEVEFVNSVAAMAAPQLPDLIDLGRAFPETQIILNHVGVPVGVGCYVGQREARFFIWRENIRALSMCPNAAVKLQKKWKATELHDQVSSKLTELISKVCLADQFDLIAAPRGESVYGCESGA